MGKRGSDDDDDAALWRKIADTASPLKGRGKISGKTAMKLSKATPAAKQPQSARPVTSFSAPKRSHVARQAPLDRQTSRQLKKGRLEVEAHVDLHGLRQRDAHAQLKRFLKTAQARGLKHVLVITGKGADQAVSRSFYEEEERGVLRNAVPHWLAESEFASLVVSFSPAPRRLGGDGALYVRLRKSQ